MCQEQHRGTQPQDTGDEAEHSLLEREELADTGAVPHLNKQQISQAESRAVKGQLTAERVAGKCHQEGR